MVRLYNSVPTDMARAARRLLDTGAALRVRFVDEPIERQEEIVASYRHLLDHGCPLHEPSDAATGGQLLRGVE